MAKFGPIAITICVGVISSNTSISSVLYQFQPETLASVADAMPVLNSENGHLIILRPSPGT